jgi:hypothetical protein
MRDINDIGSLVRTENIAYDRHVARVKATSNTALAPDLGPDIGYDLCDCYVCRYGVHLLVATLSTVALAFAVKLSMMA